MPEPKVRIEFDETNADHQLPEIFLQKPLEVAQQELAALEQQIKYAMPPRWWLWYEHWIVPNVLTGCPGLFNDKQVPIVVSVLVSIMQMIWLGIIAYMLYSEAFIGGRPRLLPNILMLLAGYAYCFAALPSSTKRQRREYDERQLKKPFRIPEDQRSELIRHLGAVLPGLRFYVMLFDWVMRKVARYRGWDNKQLFTSLVAKREQTDLAQFAHAAYRVNLCALTEQLVGPGSQVATMLAALRDRLGVVRAHKLQLDLRIMEATRAGHTLRLRGLQHAATCSNESEAALATALAELERREARARAFLSECELIVGELSATAGDDALLAQMASARANDGALIDRADDIGHLLIERLAAAYAGLQRELAERELTRYVGELGAGSVDALLTADASEERSDGEGGERAKR